MEGLASPPHADIFPYSTIQTARPAPRSNCMPDSAAIPGMPAMQAQNGDEALFVRNPSRARKGWKRLSLLLNSEHGKAHLPIGGTSRSSCYRASRLRVKKTR